MKNSKLRRALLVVACAVLLVSLSVGATLAYLTYTTEEVVNTFTVGAVEIDLDEVDVDLYGNVDGTARVKANEYKLLPGHVYPKDPTVHVKKGSEPAYIRIMVTINDLADLKAACGVAANETFLPQNFVDGWNPDKWACAAMDVDGDVCTLEFHYHSAVDARNAAADISLEPLFTHIKVPASATNTQIANLEELQIDIVAHAMQADGFATAADAWAKWGN